MSACCDTRFPKGSAVGLDWLPVAAGLLLYESTFYAAVISFWQLDEYAHGSITLPAIVWLICIQRAALFDTPCQPTRRSVIRLLVFGRLFYVACRFQAIALFESSVPVSCCSCADGRRLRAFWFPLRFVVFKPSLPGTFFDALTDSLKQHVSQMPSIYFTPTAILPVARSGFMLTIGQFRQLVADACLGLNVHLVRTGHMLFMYLTARTRMLHNAIRLVSILPIAFVANVIRVLVFVLITYHFGDEAGQGYLHGSASVVSLMEALIALHLLDWILARRIVSWF